MAFGGNVFEPEVPVEVAEEAEQRRTADTALEGEITAVGAKADTAVATVEGTWGPDDFGYLGWSFDPVLCYEGSELHTEQVHLITIKVPAAKKVKSVAIFLEKIGKELSATHNMIAAYDHSSGNRLGITGDLTAAWENVANENKIFAVNFGAEFLVPSGMCRVALLSVGVEGPHVAAYVNEKESTYRDYRHEDSEGASLKTLPAKISELEALHQKGGSRWVALS